MKRKLLLLTALFSGVGMFAQINNASFENWTTYDLYDGPADWEQHSNMEFGGVANVTWSSDAAHLLRSARIETLDTLGDTNFAYVMHGSFGDSGPDHGIPYTGYIVDSIIFWAKYDIQTNDSGTVLFVPFFGGSAIGMNGLKLHGTQSTWTRMALPVAASPMTPDEVLIAFASSDALNDYGIPGSWMMIDNIMLKDTSGAVFTPPNNSFEVWDTVRREDPVDWYTSNLLYSEDTTAFKTTDANTGSFAVQLKNVKSIFDDTLSGYLSNGPVADYWFDKVPYTAQPTSLDFSYKYLPSGADSANVYIEFFAGGSSLGGNAQWISTAASTYTPMSMSLSVPSAPDSMRIIFFAGQHEGSEFFIDDVALTGGTVGVEENIDFSNFVFHYPNPVVNNLTIQTGKEIVNNNASIQIIDLSGKVVYSGNITNQTTNLQLGNLAKGTYTYTINFGKEVISKKFIKL